MTTPSLNLTVSSPAAPKPPDLKSILIGGPQGSGKTALMLQFPPSREAMTALDLFGKPLMRAAECCRGWDFCWPESVAFLKDPKLPGAFHPPYKDRGARIEIAWNQDISVIWHEAFHCAAQKCPLMASGDDEGWIEGFCNAFAASHSGLSHAITELTPEHFQQAPYDHHLKVYTIPEMLIRKFVMDDQYAFRALWFSCCEASPKLPGFVCRLLGFNPVTGLKVEKP